MTCAGDPWLVKCLPSEPGGLRAGHIQHVTSLAGGIENTGAGTGSGGPRPRRGVAAEAWSLGSRPIAVLGNDRRIGAMRLTGVAK